MTPAEFIVKYQNRKVDFDGEDGPQCVDLYRQYCKDLGIPHTGTVNPDGAKALYLKFSERKEKEYFNRFNANLARFGDVIIWDRTQTNPYGHVAIVVEAYQQDKVLVFEQDGFAQNGTQFKIRDLKSALGLLRKRV